MIPNRQHSGTCFQNRRTAVELSLEAVKLLGGWEGSGKWKQSKDLAQVVTKGGYKSLSNGKCNRFPYSENNFFVSQVSQSVCHLLVKYSLFHVLAWCQLVRQAFNRDTPEINGLPPQYKTGAIFTGIVKQRQ